MVFDIQHYAVHDGPGIRTLVFLKGCPLRCAWCCNPESQSALPQLRHSAARCRGCLSCAKACASQAVQPRSGLPFFERRKCAACAGRECVEACPENALQMTGARLALDAVVSRVAADLPFYRNSGGGVTFSGGEPFAQAGFLLAALERCRTLGIHTAVETCGHAPAEAVRAAEPLLDLFLFDIKAVDPERHRALTGIDNRLILENLVMLATIAREKLLLRFPLVPGCTDDASNVEAIAALAEKIGLDRLSLEPYHSLGHGKYGELGLPSPEDPGAPAPQTIRKIAGVFATHGIACEVES